MNLSHIAIAVLFILVGVVFASTLRGLPGVSMLPSY